MQPERPVRKHNTTMFNFLKINCLAIYLLAIVAFFIELPWQSGPILQRIAIIILLAHCVEAVIAFKHVKAYKGSVGVSLLLTLLFGLLHWLPIARQNKPQVREA
jgi:uncharacterized protein YhhL (DUF1145 family)